MEHLIRRSKHYVLVEGKLMRKNMKEELLPKCMSQEHELKILDEIHAGTCGNHATLRTLVGKAFRASFYWPSAITDAEKLVHHCEGCQFFTKQTHVLAHELQTIPASCHFPCWGLDMIGPFKPAPEGFRWVYVIINKFSKWIGYKPLVSGTAKKAAKLLDEIIHCFSLPNSIITDMGSTFTSNDFWNFCDDRGIVVRYVSVAHPRANGQAERANDMILDALKKGLYRENDKHPRRWLKELPAMVWELRTQPSRNTGISLYMVFGSEAMLPADIAFQSPRVENHDEERSNEARELEVNCTEEQCLDTCAHMAKYLEGLRRYYNRNVKD
jgi:hypothetical protein